MIFWFRRSSARGIELVVVFYYLRAVGRKVLWSAACVCLSVCAHCFCPQDISRTGSWITTKFGGWEQGVNLYNKFNFGADRIPDAYPGSLFHFR